MKNRTLQSLIVAGIACGFASGAVLAAPLIGAVNFSGKSFVPLGPSGTTGYVFNVSQSINVMGLSLADRDANGLGGAHAVGLWNDSTGALLGSVTVQAGTSSPLDSTGIYRYELLTTPITLTPGTNYVVGAFDTGTQDNVYYYSGIQTAIPGLNFLNGRYTNNGSLGRPTNNVTFTSASFVVPEPASLGLLGLGVIGLLRRKN